MRRAKIVAVAGAAIVALALASCSSSKPEENSAEGNQTTTQEADTGTSETQMNSEGTGGSEGESSEGTTEEGTEEETGGESEGVPTEKASKDYQLAFIQGVQGDNFYITMQCGIEATAKAMGVSVTTQGPQKFDPTLQKPILDSVVASNPDAILIAPTNADAMQAPLQQAADKGIKIVLVDTTTSDPSFAVSQISSDNVGGGQAAFEAIKKAQPDGGTVLVVSVDPGITTTDDRAKGFNDAAEADGAFKTLDVEYSHNDPSTAAQIVTAALQAHPDIVGIFAANLFAAQGAATGIQQAGAVGKVTVVGFDAGPDQISALKAGTVQALVAQQPYQIGTDGVEQAVNALDGHDVTAKIQTGFTIITKDNVDTTDAAYVSSC